MNDQVEQDALLAELRTMLADVIDIDEEAIGYTTHFIDDLGVDSLMALEVMAALERKYKIKLSEDDLRKMSCLREVHKLVLSRLNHKLGVSSTQP